MARTIAPTMLFLAFVLCTSTFYKARAQAPATAPSLGPSSSSPPPSLPPQSSSPPPSLPPQSSSPPPPSPPSSSSLPPSSSSPTYGPTASAPAPGPDCFTLLLGMADCLSYVQEGSNETKPDKACCPELKTLVDTKPQCLCELLANSNSYGYKIDYDRATKLPSVCKVDTPPVSTCALLGIPVGGPSVSEVPASSPGLSPGGLPSTGPTPQGNNGHKASTAAATVVAVLVGFAITSFPTFF